MMEVHERRVFPWLVVSQLIASAMVCLTPVFFMFILNGLAAGGGFDYLAMLAVYAGYLCFVFVVIPIAVVGALARKLWLLIGIVSGLLTLPGFLRNSHWPIAMDAGSAPLLLFACLAFVYVARALARPRGTRIDLAFPLAHGRYCAVQAGANGILNHHSRVPAQRFAIDIVKLNPRSHRRLLPVELTDYAIFESPVISPCAATVIETADDTPDDCRMDRTAKVVRPAGNFVLLEREGVMILLAHLKRGSVCVAPGQAIDEGTIVGAVGSSGNSSEPHLHIHAERDGIGLPILFNGRFLRRNAVVEVGSGAT
jgi:hypothetical protein